MLVQHVLTCLDALDDARARRFRSVGTPYLSDDFNNAARDWIIQ